MTDAKKPEGAHQNYGPESGGHWKKKPECTCGQGYDPECPSDHGANPAPIRAAAMEIIINVRGSDTYRVNLIQPVAAVIRREVERERERIQKLEDRLFMLGEMERPPCFVCGYNGPNYYQPSVHPCAERHHLMRQGGK